MSINRAEQNWPGGEVVEIVGVVTISKLDWPTFQVQHNFNSAHPCYMQRAEWDCYKGRSLSTMEVLDNYWRGVAYNTPLSR